MATYTISPGAWGAGSGLNPPILRNRGLNPPIAGSSPLNPPIAGNNPLNPPIAGSNPLNPPIYGNGSQAAAEAVLAAGQPWRGTDPDWVYQGGPRALLAQALERTHSKIVRPSDPRHVPSVPGVMRAPARGPNTSAPLWRWGSEFRVQAVLADLSWRLRVDKIAPKNVSKSTPQKAPKSLPTIALKLTSTGAVTFTLDPAASAYGGTLDQIGKVQRAAIEREDRLPEILSQSDDLWSFFRVVLGINSSASPLLEEVLSVAWQWATPLVMSLKNEVAAFRPVQIAPSVLPVIPTPAHGSLPSGHATMAVLTAEILAQLLFKGDPAHARVKQLDRLARRIAFNRVVAGVHFPVDSAVGYGLGLQLAGHFVGWAKGQPAFARFDFKPASFSELTETSKQVQPQRNILADGKSESLALMWNAAVREAKRGGA